MSQRLHSAADLIKILINPDKVVNTSYRPQPFTFEMRRIEYLFGLYEQLTAPLFEAGKKPQKPRKVMGAK